MPTHSVWLQGQAAACSEKPELSIRAIISMLLSSMGWKTKGSRSALRRPQKGSELDEITVSQETVDALSRAETMEEFLAIAQREGVDWDALPDEWLSAIAEGDVTGLLPRASRRNKKVL